MTNRASYEVCLSHMLCLIIVSTVATSITTYVWTPSTHRVSTSTFCTRWTARYIVLLQLFVVWCVSRLTQHPSETICTKWTHQTHTRSLIQKKTCGKVVNMLKFYHLRFCLMVPSAAWCQSCQNCTCWIAGLLTVSYNGVKHVTLGHHLMSYRSVLETSSSTACSINKLLEKEKKAKFIWFFSDADSYTLAISWKRYSIVPVSYK